MDDPVSEKTVNPGRSSWQIQRAVVFALVMRELKTRFDGHWTGVVWLLGVPLAQLAMFMWINTTIRGRVSRSGYDFVVWLIIAMIPYDMFKLLWNKLSGAPRSNLGLFNFRQVKPMDTFIARAILEIALQAIIFVLIAVALARFGYGPLMPADFLGFINVVTLFCLLGIGMGITSAVIEDVIPRFGTVSALVSMPLVLISGVIFPLQGVPAPMMALFLYNPLLHLVELARHAYLPSYVMVQGVNLAYPASWTIAMVTLAMCLYRIRRRELSSN